MWSIWADPSREHEYDEGIEWARLDGPLTAGAKGQLKPRGAPKGAFTVLEVEPGRRILTSAGPPVAKMQFDRRLDALPGGNTRVSEQITISGPLAGLFGRLFGRSMAERLPTALTKLAEQATREPAPGPTANENPSP